MKKSSLIGHTTEVLQFVYSRGTPADSVLNTFFRNRRYLGSKDRRFISETLYSIIREIRLLEFYLEKAIPAAPQAPYDVIQFHPLLLYVVYVTKIFPQPSKEVVDDLAELWARTLPDLNLPVILSKLATLDPPSLTVADPVRRNGIIHSLPEFAVREWLERLGEAEGERLCSALNTPAPLAIRVNRLKGTLDECSRALASEGVRVDGGQLSPDGLLMEKRVNIQSLQSFQTGLFEIQDEGSQLISFLVSPVQGETVVDACAGGGGKSLHMAALMGNKGMIHAWDPDRRRLEEAMRRAERAGARILNPCAGDSQGLLRTISGKADRVLVDAPCSGSGTFRRNPWSKLFLTAEQIAGYFEIQRHILQRYSSLVCPGGRLVYATCSLLSQENEEVISSFLHGNSGFRLLDAPGLLRGQGIPVTGESPFLLLYPHRHTTDGFFAAAMERSS